VMKRINRCENANIEIRNPKQYQNPNVRNSKKCGLVLSLSVFVIEISVI